MIERDIFKNISPLDHRYSLSEGALFDALSSYLSEDGAVRSYIDAERALVYAHLAMRGLECKQYEAAFEAARRSINGEAVYNEELKTRHNIRALVNLLKRSLPAEIAPLIHLGATSADIIDTAFSYRIRGAMREVIIPRLESLQDALRKKTAEYAHVAQIGRTHGQHAVPLTAGFAFASYVSRLGKTIAEIKKRAEDLRGKLSGATGTYNAVSLLYGADKALELEERYLAVLNLKPAEHSTQIIEPEYMLRLLLECNIAFGIISNIADDMRNLQRSEIGEVKESFAAEQVGSSTMPQKRNPWNSEHVKSLWKAFAPRVMTFFMDQISEHQRDLTNSASSRFIVEYLDGFMCAVCRMQSVISKICLDEENIKKNLYRRDGEGGGVMAECAYILLAESGESGAHEVVRRLTLKCEKEKIPFSAALVQSPDVLRRIASKLKELKLIKDESEALAFMKAPENYTGLAERRALDIAEMYGRADRGGAGGAD